MVLASIQLESRPLTQIFLRPRMISCLAVLFCFVFVAPVWPDQESEKQREPSGQEILDSFIEAYTNENYEKAIALGHRLVELSPGNGLLQFYLASAYASGGKPEKSVKWLQRAAENGFDSVAELEDNEELDSVRRLPGYEIAKAGIQENYERARQEFRDLADQSEPLIVTPDGLDPDEAAMAIVVLHGYGGTAEGIVKRWRKIAASHGAILIAPRAVHQVGDRGFYWGEMEEADYILARSLRGAFASHNVDRNRVILTGFSEGGNMALALGMKHPDQYSGIIPIGASYEPDVASPPEDLPDKRPRVYLMIGEKDPSLESNRQALAGYRSSGIPVELRVFPGLGHSFPKDAEAALAEALQFVLSE